MHFIVFFYLYMYMEATHAKYYYSNTEENINVRRDNTKTIGSFHRWVPTNTWLSDFGFNKGTMLIRTTSEKERRCCANEGCIDYFTFDLWDGKYFHSYNKIESKHQFLMFNTFTNESSWCSIPLPMNVAMETTHYDCEGDSFKERIVGITTNIEFRPVGFEPTT